MPRFLRPVARAFPRITGLLQANRLLVLVLIIALVRLAILGLYPLMDTTEARYGEISRVMAENGDWITPWYRQTIPFWAKPPLSFWTTAISYKFLGVNEFAGRFSHWSMGIIGGFVVWNLGARRSEREAVIAVTLLSGSLVYYFSSGAIMTDMALTLGLTVGMASFWIAIQPNQSAGLKQRSTWLFFASIGWGLLAKGPIAIVLTALPLSAWLILSRSHWQTARELPWLRGALLTAAISLPWYFLAELKTPGFLNYFIIGEHLQRFLIPGWKGDLFGDAHLYPKGTIWGFAILMLLPWSIILPLATLKPSKKFPFIKKNKDKNIQNEVNGNSEWRNYLLSWALAPIIFFTFSGNILPAYVLPSVPAGALLIAALIKNQDPKRIDKTLALGLIFILICSSIFPIAVSANGTSHRKSQKDVVEAFKSESRPNSKLVYFKEVPYSASFYTRGQAISTPECRDISSLAPIKGNYYIVEKVDKNFACNLGNLAKTKEIFKNKYFRITRIGEARLSKQI